MGQLSKEKEGMISCHMRIWSTKTLQMNTKQMILRKNERIYFKDEKDIIVEVKCEVF